MALQLHIWGPAFGLPSIDAYCNAAVALLHFALDGGDAAWELVPSYDISISPSGQFPVLLDGNTRVAGYAPILKHLQHYHNVNLDAHLSPNAQATATAMRSFLATAALPLIDLSLYCTYQNYYNVTRPAYTPILPWHTNYAYPPARRDEARARTAHLGLSSLDVETLYDDMDKYTTQGASISGQFEATKKAAEQGRSKGPSLLPLGMRGRLIGSVAHGDRFKLQRVANRFFEPLDAMLGGKRWLLAEGEEEGPGSADVLAWGCLSLMLGPECPQGWLREALHRWPRLVKYTERMSGDILRGQSIAAQAVMKGERSGSLPWQLPPPVSSPGTALTVGRELMRSIPVPPQLAYLDVSAPSISTAGVITRLFALSSLAFSVLLGVGYHFATQSAPTWDYEFRTSDFADADDVQATFKGSANGMNASDVLEELQRAVHPTLDLDPGQERERERMGGGIVGEVEVDMEVK